MNLKSNSHGFDLPKKVNNGQADESSVNEYKLKVTPESKFIFSPDMINLFFFKEMCLLHVYIHHFKLKYLFSKTLKN